MEWHLVVDRVDAYLARVVGGDDVTALKERDTRDAAIVTDQVGLLEAAVLLMCPEDQVLVAVADDLKHWNHSLDVTSLSSWAHTP